MPAGAVLSATWHPRIIIGRKGARLSPAPLVSTTTMTTAVLIEQVTMSPRAPVGPFPPVSVSTSAAALTRRASPEGMEKDDEAVPTDQTSCPEAIFSSSAIRWAMGGWVS
jgi:hypothetical protein